jgi:hypothetical protein
MPTGRRSRPFGLVVVLFLMAAGCAGDDGATTTTPTTGPAEQTTTTVEAALAPFHALIVAFERAEVTGDPAAAQAAFDAAAVFSRGEPDFLTDMMTAYDELAAYLEAHPDDVDALILFGRLGRIQTVVQPIVIVEGRQEQFDIEPSQAALHRALELDPGRADAAYWQARLYGLSQPTIEADGVVMRTRNLEMALSFARLAVSLAPDNEQYREALALYLFEAEELDEALRVMDEGVALGGDPMGPIRLLLADLVALPLPATAEFLADETDSQVDSVGALLDFARLRIRVHLVPQSADQLESFYSDHFPGFTLFDCEPLGQASTGTAVLCLQFLTPDDDTFRPASSSEQLAQSRERRSEGILMVVIEMDGVASEERTFRVPPNAPEHFVIVITQNFRSV